MCQRNWKKIPVSPSASPRLNRGVAGVCREFGPFTNRKIVPFIVHTSKNGTDWELAESFNYTRVK
jgi:hypothetical protein